MSEFDETLALAHRILDRPGADPDDDLAMLARQFIRAVEARDFYREAIRKHRDYHGDDRCHLDDGELYAILPEGDTRPASDTAVTLENCRRFIECRQQGREYVSPEREIENLRAALESDRNFGRYQFGEYQKQLATVAAKVQRLEANARSVMAGNLEFFAQLIDESGIQLGGPIVGPGVVQETLRRYAKTIRAAEGMGAP